jgi:sodium transport system ATP-binding protein
VTDSPSTDDSAPERVLVCDLVKEFPTVDGPARRAVNGVSFHVRAGEIYGLLGPNGAGKTTTLRVLSGLMAPTRGRVMLNGIDVQREPMSAKRYIGFLTANTGLYQRLSPRELLPYFAELNGLDREVSRRRVAALIDLLGMKDFADVRCGALSTGQKQRTNIARALIADPPILIMDEPTLGLDVLTNRVILEFIRRERDAGKAIVLSTHYLDEAETLCDRIGLLHEGRLVAEGTMPQLRASTGKERLTEIFLTIAQPPSIEVNLAPGGGDNRARSASEGFVSDSSQVFLTDGAPSDPAEAEKPKSEISNLKTEIESRQSEVNSQSAIRNPQSVDTPNSQPEVPS